MRVVLAYRLSEHLTTYTQALKLLNSNTENPYLIWCGFCLPLTAGTTARVRR